ncbi:MAG: MATE family efflux transporter [Phocaeicola sp.]|nr:MATE family efflux transporter [Phocaeicola sp.]
MLSILNNKSSRTKTLVNDISFIAIFKIINILCSFIIIPLTIDYVSPSIYGIWLTLYSIISWFSIFDVGLGNGLRNKLSEALAFNDYDKSKKLISTTYVIISKIALILFCFSILSIYILDWNKILKIPTDFNENINTIIIVFSLGFCIRFIVQLISNVFFAIQKAYLSELCILFGNIITLILIIFIKDYFDNKLTFLVCALLYPGIISLIGISIFLFKTKRYKILSPSIKYNEKGLINDLFSLGTKFFLLQISSVISYSIVNFLIIQFLTPEDVTKYNIAYKYFSILLIANNIICTPLWSTFTEAFVKEDYTWLKKTIKTLIKIWIVWGFVTIIMVLLSNFIYKIWIGQDLEIPISLSIVLGLFMLNCAWNGIFTSFINGTGKIFIQMITGIFPLILWWPLSVLFVEHLNFGVTGFALCMLIFNLLSTIFTTIQVKKILNKTATGIWYK